MGCDEVKDKSEKTPKLLMIFEKGNEEQKQYCIELTKSFEPDNDIQYEINEKDKFCIQIIFPDGKKELIEEEFKPENKENCLKKMMDIVNDKKV